MTEQNTSVVASPKSLVSTYAHRMGVEPEKLLHTLKQTAFRQKGEEQVSNEQMMALLVVANKYDLNPFVKEIYAYPDKNGIVPIVGVDGWSRMINNHAQFDGLEFDYSEDIVKSNEHKPCPAWVKCRIYRKDRARPVEVTEFFDEVYRPPFEGTGRNGKYTVNGPWQSHTKRMLRHKALIQCARMAFGYTGIYDEDEAERIVEQRVHEVQATTQTTEKAAAENISRRLMAPEPPPQEPEAIEGELAEPEEPAQPAPEPPKESPVDAVLRAINDAEDGDALDIALDLMNTLELSAAQKKALMKAYESRQKELGL